MMEDKILSQFTTECPWRDTLYWYNETDSTNTRAKLMAQQGAPQGTVLIAGSQTGGRGRLGRSFISPAGMGVYLSVILRPGCKPGELMHLTCAAAVAACKAIKQVCGIFPDIKWINDLVWGNKKLGGILCELGICPRTGSVDYAIVGIGINCCQKPTDFPRELQEIAVSLQEVTGKPCAPAHLAAALTEEFFQMSQTIFTCKTEIMDCYRQHCITLNKEISLLRGEDVERGTALSLDDDGGLTVLLSDGTVKTVTSGEVSVRGMYGYL